jgi:hypothetical protein
VNRTVVGLLGLVVVAALVGIALHGPIAQPVSYHGFADSRSWLGVPNFANVVSNLAFLVVGGCGLREILTRQPSGIVAGLEHAYLAFFTATLGVAIGSSYYHLAPSDQTLVWDRLPMAIGFTAFVAIVIGERFDRGWGRRALLPLVAFGLGSVLYWRASGDLRPYVAVQFVPILAIPVVLLATRPRLVPDYPLWLVLAAYVAAKACESYDDAILARLHWISGHTLKHLVAAAGLYCFVLAVRIRRPAT